MTKYAPCVPFPFETLACDLDQVLGKKQHDSYTSDFAVEEHFWGLELEGALGQTASLSIYISSLFANFS
jgi:hypothetical protein